MKYTAIDLENKAKEIRDTKGIAINIRKYGLGFAIVMNGEDVIRGSNINSLIAYLVGFGDGVQHIRDEYAQAS